MHNITSTVQHEKQKSKEQKAQYQPLEIKDIMSFTFSLLNSFKE